MDTFFKSHQGKTLISIIWGFGLATLLRPVCSTNEKSCIAFQHSILKSQEVYKNGKKCMSFQHEQVPCTSDSIPINQSILDFEKVLNGNQKTRIKLHTIDLAVLCLFIAILYLLSKWIDSIVFPIALFTFCLMVLLHMYIGPTKKIIYIHPTPFNETNVYETTSGSCFKYNTVDATCDKKSTPLPIN